MLKVLFLGLILENFQVIAQVNGTNEDKSILRKIREVDEEVSRFISDREIHWLPRLKNVEILSVLLTIAWLAGEQLYDYRTRCVQGFVLSSCRGVPTCRQTPKATPRGGF